MSVGRGRERHESLHVRYRKSPEYPGGREVDLGALEDYGKLEMSVGSARETHESLHVRYRKSPECAGEREVNLGALEDYGKLQNGFEKPPGHPGRYKVTFGAPVGFVKLERGAGTLTE